jgi:hypothetical protein
MVEMFYVTGPDVASKYVFLVLVQEKPTHPVSIDFLSAKSSRSCGSYCRSAGGASR